MYVRIQPRYAVIGKERHYGDFSRLAMLVQLDHQLPLLVDLLHDATVGQNGAKPRSLIEASDECK